MYSHPYEIEPPRIVNVSALRHKRVELENALGLDMQSVLVSVLREHGADLGWHAGEKPDTYVLDLAEEPAVRLTIDVGSKPLAIVREATGQVEEALADPTKARFEEMLEKLEADCDLALNRLWDACYTTGLEIAAREMGEVVERVSTPSAEAYSNGLLIRLMVPV